MDGLPDNEPLYNMAATLLPEWCGSDLLIQHQVVYDSLLVFISAESDVTQMTATKLFSS